MATNRKPKEKSNEIIDLVFEARRALKVKQPAYWAFAKYNYTALEQRIKYVLMYLAQKEIKGETLTFMGTTQIDENNRRIITIPIKILQGNSNSNNYEDINEAVNSFAKKPLSIKNDQGDYINIYPFIGTALRQIRGHVQVTIDGKVWKGFREDSHHYSEFDLVYALQLKSYIAMRLYEIANTIQQGETFELEELREMFGLENKYPNISDFKRVLERHIEKSLKETDMGLTMTTKYIGASHKIDSIELSPVCQIWSKEHEKHIQKIVKDYGIHWLFSAEEIDTLKRIGFHEQDICANAATLKRAEESIKQDRKSTDTFVIYLQNLAKRAKEKDNPQGWIIRILQNKFAPIKTEK